MKKFVAILTAALLLALAVVPATAEEATPIVIGATPSPHAEILEFIKDDMAS